MRQQKQEDNARRQKQVAEERRIAMSRQNEFVRDKVAAARTSIQEHQFRMQKEISSYEKEAQDLERMEADLLRKLQETQQNEKAAFSRLENAMVDASIPKKMRKLGNSTVDSQMSLPGKSGRGKSSDPNGRRKNIDSNHGDSEFAATR